MPPKNDPYVSTANRAVDLLLILLTIVIIAIAVWTSPRIHARAGNDAPHSKPDVSLAANDAGDRQ